MNSFFQKLLHLGVGIETVLKRAWQGIERLFLSKAEVARRDSGRFVTLKRREMETERLDRIRNPRDYQGK
ncbi:MAG: hypothetical protein HY043_05260 [Verrucomicrobia bacterium]|nr:hypothetical protein [Verrucomicrobiota bacterium]